MLPLRKLFPLLLLSALPLQAQDAPDPLNPVTHEILVKNWEQAARQLDKAEKEGLCKEAVCLALHARIAEGAGDGAQALAYARRAAALFGPDSGLNAADYNELGAIVYRRGNRDPETLKLAETAFRKADAIYNATLKAGASNIRFNLATVLKAQGRTKEAKQIMDALEAEGMLIDPQMAILGDFQRPGLQ
jgi:Flp pilus assembly protein TadD